MEFLDTPLAPDMAEKLKIFVPYLYTDTAKLLLIMELLNIFLTINNIFTLVGLQIHSRTRIILGNVFVIELLAKLIHLLSISFIYDESTVTYKGALIFIIMFASNYGFYILSKIICITALTSDNIMNSERLKNWKILVSIYLIIAAAVLGGVATFVYDTSLISLYAGIVVIVIFILVLYISVGILRKEFKRWFRSNTMTESDFIRMTLLRIIIYVPTIVGIICLGTINKQIILDLSPLGMFLYFIYARRISNKKARDALKKASSDKKSK